MYDFNKKMCLRFVSIKVSFPCYKRIIDKISAMHLLALKKWWSSIFSNKTLDTSQKFDSLQVLHPFLKISKFALNIETLEDILTDTGKLFQLINGITSSPHMAGSETDAVTLKVVWMNKLQHVDDINSFYNH